MAAIYNLLPRSKRIFTTNCNNEIVEERETKYVLRGLNRSRSNLHVPRCKNSIQELDSEGAQRASQSLKDFQFTWSLYPPSWTQTEKRANSL